MDGNSKGITSPGLKRRLSKERLSMSKMIDMQKEKADLMHSFERMDEEQNVSNGNNRTDSSPTPSQPLPDSVSNNTDSGYSQKNNSTQSTNDVSTNEIPTHSHSRNNSLTGSGSPKNTRSMSQRMLARLNMFETTGNGSSTTGGSPVPLSPLTTSTPLNSPPVVQHGSLERKSLYVHICTIILHTCTFTCTITCMYIYMYILQYIHVHVHITCTCIDNIMKYMYSEVSKIDCNWSVLVYMHMYMYMYM